MFLYNSLDHKKEKIIPVEEGRIKLYVCGPTVYDDSHIGHARAVLVFDVLVRHLRAQGYQVTYVRNFTDLDDKIINRSREEGLHFLDLANNYIKSFHQDMDALGALRPDVEPRATDYIDLMITDVQGIMASGHAYQVAGDVYFDVTRLPSYGRLSGRNIEDMQAGARVEVDERKRHPLDFALWKESKPGEPSWDSPWGPGRPGWHIECSAMSNRLLGQEFDIHGGGHDLVFPHHENELAQSNALGRKFARYWMHNGFVRVNQEKMSKSLKNFFTVKEVLGRFKPEVLRLFLLAKHYRSPIDFSDDGLKETHRSLERAYRSLQTADEIIPRSDSSQVFPETSTAWNAFQESMNDDLNTARALGNVFDSVRELNRWLDEFRAGSADITAISAWRSVILCMGSILGILQGNPAEWLQSENWSQVGLPPEQIEGLIQARTAARARKDWVEADRIRAELKAHGIVLEDAKGQTKWRVEN